MVRLIKAALACLLAMSSGGCITAKMWERANDQQLYFPEFKQFVAGGSNPDRAPGVLIGYTSLGLFPDLNPHLATNRSPGDPEPTQFILIPTDPQGAPLPPYRIASLPATMEETRAAQTIQVKVSDYYSPAQIARMSGNVSVHYFSDPAEPAVTGTGDLNLFSVIALRKKGTDKEVVFLVVPTHPPRPGSEIGKSRVVAALLTPVTLIADVVVDPVVLIAYLILQDQFVKDWKGRSG